MARLLINKIILIIIKYVQNLIQIDVTELRNIRKKKFEFL